MPQDDTASISICPASLFSHLLLPPALRSAFWGDGTADTPLPGVSLRVLLDAEGQPWFVTRDVAQALGYALPSKAVLDNFNYAKILKYANSAG